jgi:hypothetical protein
LVFAYKITWCDYFNYALTLKPNAASSVLIRLMNLLDILDLWCSQVGHGAWSLLSRSVLTSFYRNQGWIHVFWRVPLMGSWLRIAGSAQISWIGCLVTWNLLADPPQVFVVRGWGARCTPFRHWSCPCRGRCRNTLAANVIVIPLKTQLLRFEFWNSRWPNWEQFLEFWWPWFGYYDRSWSHLAYRYNCTLSRQIAEIWHAPCIQVQLRFWGHLKNVLGFYS